MEELIQALASGGRTVQIEYTGDRLLQATVLSIEGASGRVLVRREGTTAALALRDCAVVLMMSSTACSCDCLPCQSCDHR